MASPTAAQQQHQQPHPQGLPSISSLTNNLPMNAPISPDQSSLADSTRDSGTWPQPGQNKHLGGNLQVHTLLNPDESPSRQSLPNTPNSGRIPGTALSGSSALPSINQGFHDNANRDSYNTRDSYASGSSYNRDSYASGGSHNRDSLARDFNRDSQFSRDSRDLAPHLDSRRSSVDSRMHQGFNSMHLANGPTSPYEGNNSSQVSLAALRRPPSGQPLSPLSARSSVRANPAPRIAPPIMPISRGPGAPDPTAAKPTAGYAWAFPDSAIPEERRGSDSGDSSGDQISRQNSFAASSIRSSIFSTDSQMPPGQRRFDDGMLDRRGSHVGSVTDYGDTTHHHSMNRTIQNLQAEGMPPGVGNYSRTPELRVSHKLAERKRRSEMKDLFEELNKAVPSNGGTKASKWEILTKAIEYIRSTQHQERSLHAEVTRLQRDNEYGREAHKENDMLKTEVQVMHQHLRRLDPNAPHVYGHFTSQLQQQQQNGPQANGNGNQAPPALNLPPLNAPNGSNGQNPGSSHGQSQFQGGPPPPAAMQGVEYGFGR